MVKGRETHQSGVESARCRPSASRVTAYQIAASHASTRKRDLHFCMCRARSAALMAAERGVIEIIYNRLYCTTFKTVIMFFFCRETPRLHAEAFPFTLLASNSNSKSLRAFRLRSSEMFSRSLSLLLELCSFVFMARSFPLSLLELPDIRLTWPRKQCNGVYNSKMVSVIE